LQQDKFFTPRNAAHYEIRAIQPASGCERSFAIISASEISFGTDSRARSQSQIARGH
jgi:hypothetical protein